MLKLACFALSIGLTGCGSHQTQSSQLNGTAEQDPVISHYRLAFAQSRTPALPDLRSGQVWTCYFRYAYKDDFREGQGLTYVFQSQGDRIVNYGSGAVKSFVLAVEGMTGATTGGYVLSHRLTGDGHLVGEWSTEPGWFPNSYSNAAIANPTRRAYAYEYCQPL